MLTPLEKPSSLEEIEQILTPLVKRWFFSRFKSFSLTQLYGVPKIHQRSNILISAPTGGTKTLTAFLSILNELVDSAEKGLLKEKVYCIYVSPLKALGNDIKVNLLAPLTEMEELAGKTLGIRIGVRTGDTTAAEKSVMLKHPPHILITTPESLAIALASLKFSEHLKRVQWVIVDEIHALAESKRGVHLSLSLEWLQQFSPALTRVGLSATISPLEEVAQFLVGFERQQARDCLIADVQLAKKMDLKVLCPVEDLVEVDYGRKYSAMYHLIHQLIQEHKTTLIFTNTRSATERVIHNLKELYPRSWSYPENIAAHHGSLGKELRENTEERLRKGELKVVVSSTSLELGIDIGYIDLVICLGSPKSVARFMQRIGRSGHRLHETIKSRIIVMDRDDLVECSVLLKDALERKIDKIHLPQKALDVLAQQIVGFASIEKMSVYSLFNLVRNSFCYHTLEWNDFDSVLKYLAGEYASLEDRHVYAKIWYDRETGMLGRKGKLTKVLYLTNIGTIPEEAHVLVKVNNQTVGKIDEAFLEKLKPGDVFVLGGEVYEFKFSRGMTCQVKASVNRPPTVPSWFSEMLPLSFDLALDLGRLRRLLAEQLERKKSKAEILQFLSHFLYLDENAAQSFYDYFSQQFHFSKIPSDKLILIEQYKDRERTYFVFHTLFGRRVNDCLSRALAFALARLQKVNVEIGITDNGFYLSSENAVSPLKAFLALKPEDLRSILEQALEKSEILSRRFRHCACRALMILREYKGKKKQVGRQQLSSRLLMSAVQRIDPNFPLLKEARREVLEDLMDFENTRLVLDQVAKKQIAVEEVQTVIPSPFAFNLILQGYEDIIKIEDRQDFLRRMHQLVLAKISLKQGKKKISEQKEENFSYNQFWENRRKKELSEQEEKVEQLKLQVWNLKKVPAYAKEELIRFIDGGKMREDVWREIRKHFSAIEKEWPIELKNLVLGKLEEQ